MDRKLNKVIAEYVGNFKKGIKEKALQLTFTEEPKIHELIEYIYNYERLTLSKEDVSKRKRVKNTIPCMNRCTAKRANGEQCTRKQKSGFVYCGTHVKGIPHGTISSNREENNSYINTEVIAEEVNGIVYYLDKNGNIFSTEDVLKQVPNPKVIARYTLSNGVYTIYSISNAPPGMKAPVLNPAAAASAIGE
jgi:hypothetical protein